MERFDQLSYADLEMDEKDLCRTILQEVREANAKINKTLQLKDAVIEAVKDAVRNHVDLPRGVYQTYLAYEENIRQS